MVPFIEFHHWIAEAAGSWYTFAFLFTGFITYYLVEVVKPPTLACSQGKLKEFLDNEVPLLKSKFWPTIWCFESRAQTIFASILRSSILPDISYRREILRMTDGGEVGLDWSEDGCPSNAPIIIILPGLTGSSQAEYIKCLVLGAKRHQLRVVVFNNRGLGGLELKTPRTYCAANCEDITAVVDHVIKANPGVPIGATGISMGGLILGNYLAEQEAEACKKLKAAMIISVPWNVFIGTESIERPWLNRLLNRHLASSLCNTVKEFPQKHQHLYNLETVLKSQTIREFDSTFTVKQFGYRDVEDYYSQATLHNKLDRMRIPTLCLSAADDPFQPVNGIPMDAARRTQHVAIAVTTRGGHIGFMEGIFPLKQDQYIGKLFSQFFSAIFRHRDVLVE